MEMPKTIIESAMVISLDYGRVLAKKELVDSVEQVFPGAVKKDELTSKGEGVQLPPGVSIDAGNYNFFVASDKCVVKFRGLPITDEFMEVALRHFGQWIKNRPPRRIVNVSYRETYLMPGTPNRLYSPPVADCAFLGGDMHALYRFRPSNAFLEVEQRHLRRRGEAEFSEMLRITSTSAKEEFPGEAYAFEMAELRQLTRQAYYSVSSRERED